MIPSSAFASVSGLEGNVAIVADRADESSMTEAQAKTVGDAEAYIVRMTDSNGDVGKIDGEITISFRSGTAGIEGKSAFMVSEDGTRSPVDYTVDGHEVHIFTDSPSVFFIGNESEKPSGCCSCCWIWLFIVVGSIVMLILWIIASRKEAKE